jgi:hypothetical protein
MSRTHVIAWRWRLPIDQSRVGKIQADRSAHQEALAHHGQEPVDNPLLV